MTIAEVRDRLLRAFEDREPLDFSLLATCVLLAVDPYSRGIAVILSLAAILWRPIRRSPFFWFVTAGVAAWGLFSGWPHLDNHKYLIAYWLFALGCSFLTAEPERAAARNARILIGLTFVLATLQKLTSPDYVEGTYFYVSMLRDARFFPLTQWIGGLGYEQLVQNHAAVRALQSATVSPETVVLAHSPSILVVARLVTWWTLAIEAAVAAAFLAPPSSRIHGLRDGVLLLFVFTTYVLAPVPQFGWILIAMALAQTEPTARLTRLLYGVSFLAVLGYVFPMKTYSWEVASP